jgi:hypothetical protein
MSDQISSLRELDLYGATETFYPLLDDHAVWSQVRQIGAKSRSTPLEAELRLAPHCGVQQFLKSVGPGLITGAADDDPSGISTYSVAGVLWVRNSLDRTFVLSATIGIGLVGAVGAAVTGVTDWQDADAPARRLGLIHGLLNISATSLFVTSLVLRKKKSRTSGRVFAALGYAIMSGGDTGGDTGTRLDTIPIPQD